MKKNIIINLIFTLTILANTVYAQDLLVDVPKTREDFIASEKNVVATIDWLENTPLNQEEEKRKDQNALLIRWITDSPTVSLEINADVIPFFKKTPELLPIFMGGWTRYAIQNNHSKDAVEGSIAGLRSAIKVYKTGLLKKDKEMEKLVERDNNGELESWVKSKIKK